MKRLLALPLVVLCVFLYVRCSEGASPAQGHFDLGKIYLDQAVEDDIFSLGKVSEYGEAIAEFKKAIGIDPNHAGAYNGLGDAYSRQAEARLTNGGGRIKRHKYDLAVRFYQKAISIDPEDAVIHRSLGIAYYEQGKYDLAVESFQKAIIVADALTQWPLRTGQGRPPYYYLALAYREQGKYDLAIESYQEAITINPEDAWPHYYLALAYYEQGKYDLAIESFQKAITINPEDAEAHYYLACVYSLHDKKALSIESLRKAISLDKDSIGAAEMDSDFDNIRESPEFQALIRPVE